MTYLRRDPNNISNHFDELLAGIGHRGSSFMDIDCLIHDGHRKRFLLCEFKRRDEQLSPAQEWALSDWASIPGNLSLAIWWIGDDEYIVRFYPNKEQDRVCGNVIRSIVQQWWNLFHSEENNGSNRH